LRPFTDGEIDRLAMFADQASLAFETSRLGATVAGQSEELARFLPKQVAELVSSPDGARMLEGHRREITVVFTDLRGFTSFAGDAEPEEVMGVLAEYHREMGRLVTDHDGTLSGFSGDGLMIYFNDPIPMPDHAARAISVARAMQSAFVSLSAGLAPARLRSRSGDRHRHRLCDAGTNRIRGTLRLRTNRHHCEPGFPPVRRDRTDRLPLRPVLVTMVEHHPDRPLTQLVRVLPSPLLMTCHSSILSKAGASTKPGAAHQH
jgi:hypothetical protein